MNQASAIGSRFNGGSAVDIDTKLILSMVVASVITAVLMTKFVNPYLNQQAAT